jgi:hypothetical protein
MIIYHPSAAEVRNAARLYMSQGRDGTSLLNQQGYTTADTVRAQLHRALGLESEDAVSLATVEVHMKTQFPAHPVSQNYYFVTGV